jgi:putative PIN family toxin of toxin-antitoxin system
VRLVLDTNIVTSGLLWRGTPYQLLTHVKETRSLQLVSSPALLDELADVIMRKQFVKRLALIEQSSAQVLADYLQVVELVEPVSIPPTFRDPDDDAVLACALAAHADLIVSGDDDLLILSTFEGIPIVTPAVALQMIETRSR